MEPNQRKNKKLAHLCASALRHGLAKAYVDVQRSGRSPAELVLLQELALVGRLRDHVARVAAHHAWSGWHPRRRHVHLGKKEKKA